MNPARQETILHSDYGFDYRVLPHDLSWCCVLYSSGGIVISGVISGTWVNPTRTLETVGDRARVARTKSSSVFVVSYRNP